MPTLSSDKINFEIVYFVALGAFSLGMSSYIIAGLIPFIQNEFNISTALTAQLATAFTLAYGIGSPLVVALLPENKQKFGIILALLVFAITNFISGISPNFKTLFISRIFSGIGAGVYLAIGISVSTAVVSTENRGKAISLIMSGMAAGTVLGVPVGLLISKAYGWKISMFIIAILSLVSLIGLIIKLPQISLEKQNLIDKLKILKDKKILGILSISLIAAISSLGLYTYLAPLMANSDFGSIRNITPFLWVWGIGGISGSYIIGYFSNKIKNSKLTTIIILILALSLISIPFLSNINSWLALIPISIWGAVGWALQVPQNDQLINIRKNKGGGNLAIALNESALYLGGSIGSGLGGLFFYFNFSLWFLPILAGLVALIGLFIQLTFKR